MIDQHQNFKSGILKRKARIEEINLILSQPIPAGSHPTPGSRRRLIEARLRHEQAVAELEREDARLFGARPIPEDPEKPFRWEDLDQRLLSPKVQGLAREMHERAIEADRKATLETRLSGNSARYLPRLFEMQRELTDEWAKRLYEISCEVWRIQGQPITPDFIRGMRDRPIPQLIATRKGAVQHSVDLWALRTRKPGQSPAIGSWNRSMDSLAIEWRLRLESEAVSCEYRARARPLQTQQTAPYELMREAAEGGLMRYPTEFPSESRARVEAAKIRAGRDFDTAKQSARWSSDVEALLRSLILRTLVAFAKEAGSLRLWSVEKMDAECREFLRLATVDAYYQKGYDQSGGRLREMTSNWNGAILSEVQRNFEREPEWKQYQDTLLEVADAQILRTKTDSTVTQVSVPRVNRADKSGSITIAGRKLTGCDKIVDGALTTCPTKPDSTKSLLSAT